MPETDLPAPARLDLSVDPEFALGVAARRAEVSGEEVVSTSKYRGHFIRKIRQESGRVSYDVHLPDGSVNDTGHYSLAVARAEVDAIVD